MRILLVTVVTLGCLSVSSPLPAQTAEDGDADQGIAKLIEGLNDDRFSVRRESERALLKLGEPAIKALEELSKSDDNNQRVRAQRLLRRLLVTLTLVDEVSDDSLLTVTSVVISRCGKFAYTAAHGPGAISCFTRDPSTGSLSHVQTIADPETMAGAVSLRLSPDQRWAVASCFRSKSLVLFQINPESGTLNRRGTLNRIGPNESKPMNFTVESVFSPDSKFVYAIDPSLDRVGGLVTFRLENDQLKWVETNAGENGCFSGARGIACHPNGKFLYVVGDSSSTLTVVQRDTESGKTKILATYQDEEDGILGLGGAFSVACSPDGRFVYTSSGRFRGDDTISVFKVAEDGSLSIVQEIANGDNGLDGFLGGNEILVSPDGKFVYAAATRSSLVAGFHRDPETGRLKVRDLEPIDRDDLGQTLGPAGLGISPDGQHLYVAAESPGKIIIFRRGPKD